ncbi:quinolinate synthase NadA [Endomicrobium proavitum]|uniref:Quinolinate synthase n=1 Tax=Endomicrobium proavitum TaxID=1408281 RepID=A0A0G3WJ93_9BACT|nr:quinolinate synthase NadA [Endomicrobium proavitum]AKL98403.1 Quinolinate synthase A [Endomicrobium proavitum]
MNEITEKLNKLKKEKNAVILAHIYQLPEIQDVADFVGDSLDLSRKAAQTKADIIVFCGVHFMAETAAILSPQKKVLIPDVNAGCPMADMITASALKELKSKYKNPVVVAYVNTSAAVKAESDICCTSSNALNVVKSVESGDIIFVPDRNLGSYVQKNSGKEMFIWNGFCPTHNNLMLPEHILKAKAEHPNAEILVHPECRPEVAALADHAMSTGVMCRYVPTSSKKEFIIGTETGILYKLQKENPDKKFYPVSSLAVCPNMKKITLAKVLDVLFNETNIVTVPEEIRKKAYLPIERMLKIQSA